MGPSAGAETVAVPDQHATPAQGGTCVPATFKVVIDVGHTVEAGGATSARGVPEYVFNSRLAKRIERHLLEAGFVRTDLMITRGVGRPQLAARAARANAAGADLFVSVHHDSVQDFYLGKWPHDGRVDRFSDKFSGYSIFISNDSIRSAESLDFARFLGNERSAPRWPRRPIDFARCRMAGAGRISLPCNRPQCAAARGAAAARERGA